MFKDEFKRRVNSFEEQYLLRTAIEDKLPNLDNELFIALLEIIFVSFVQFKLHNMLGNGKADKLLCSKFSIKTSYFVS